MSGVRRLAPAKLNLSLRVFPRRSDGYHDLESLMVALPDLADEVTVRRSEARSVVNRGFEEDLDQERNLAWRALDALEAEVGETLSPLAVEIDKRIPSQAGLGGGSSDAAATLLAADDILGLDLGSDRLERVAARVGSDVPFFIRGGCQWALGRGERLSPGACPALDLAIVVPPVSLSTARVYAALDRMPPPPVLSDPWLSNDLWPAALAEAPGLGAWARALNGRGARTTLLCGSGSAVAGVFEDSGAAHRAAAAIAPQATKAVAVRTPAISMVSSPSSERRDP